MWTALTLHSPLLRGPGDLRQPATSLLQLGQGVGGTQGRHCSILGQRVGSRGEAGVPIAGPPHVMPATCTVSWGPSCGLRGAGPLGAWGAEQEREKDGQQVRTRGCLGWGDAREWAQPSASHPTSLHGVPAHLGSLGLLCRSLSSTHCHTSCDRSPSSAGSCSTPGPPGAPPSRAVRPGSVPFLLPPPLLGLERTTVQSTSVSPQNVCVTSECVCLCVCIFSVHVLCLFRVCFV